MKDALYKLANMAAFLFCIAICIFFWVAVEDGDIITFKNSLTGLIP